jgi:uncharacterized Ntn-hydrolase superfamily protein
MTFSLLGRDAETGEVGIAITSSSPAVAARCAYARTGVGVAATQNTTDPRLGPLTLDALETGDAAVDALAAARRDAHGVDHRQLVALPLAGSGAVWSGAKTLGVHAARVGGDAAAAGNLLSGEHVVPALIDGFDAARGRPLVERLLAGLRAGVDAGGEAGPLHSAGLLVCGRVPWPEVDLRVDWAEDDPVGQLEALWTLFAPQRAEYVTRALDPDAAPGFGVPGDDR